MAALELLVIYTVSSRMDRETWIAACAHRLQRQWRTVDPEQLEEVAAELWRDARLREMAPADAAVAWLGLLLQEPF
jgi:hypothetical protein